LALAVVATRAGANPTFSLAAVAVELRQDHRTIISGVLFRERTGVTWRDLPERFGPWKTVYQRKRRWAMGGTWQRICQALRIDCDADEGADWTVGVDSASIRAHQHAAGARGSPAADHP
jgi:transposase